MTNQQHPITPPPELVREWNHAAAGTHFPPYGYSEYIATQAAQWGADQELEACCQWIGERCGCSFEEYFRAARRPRPPSLREQALSELNLTADPDGAELSRTQVELIRRALEQLDD